MGSGEKVTVGALVVVPGPGGTVTFVRQERGPYAGAWLLPGGKVEFGESVEDAARRETVEESGCVVGLLAPVGLYEMRGAWTGGRYHFVMTVFRAEEPVVVPAGFAGHHVGEVRQLAPAAIAPHVTDMVILNDAGVANYPREDIARLLAADGIVMTRLLACAGAVAVQPA